MILTPGGMIINDDKGLSIEELEEDITVLASLGLFCDGCGHEIDFYESLCPKCGSEECSVEEL